MFKPKTHRSGGLFLTVIITARTLHCAAQVLHDYSITRLQNGNNKNRCLNMQTRAWAEYFFFSDCECLSETKTLSRVCGHNPMWHGQSRGMDWRARRKRQGTATLRERKEDTDFHTAFIKYMGNKVTLWEVVKCVILENDIYNPSITIKIYLLHVHNENVKREYFDPQRIYVLFILAVLFSIPLSMPVPLSFFFLSDNGSPCAGNCCRPFQAAGIASSAGPDLAVDETAHRRLRVFSSGLREAPLEWHTLSPP